MQVKVSKLNLEVNIRDTIINVWGTFTRMIIMQILNSVAQLTSLLFNIAWLVEKIILIFLEKELMMKIERNILQWVRLVKEITSFRVIEDSMFVVEIKDSVRCAILSALQVLDTHKLGKTGEMAMEVNGRPSQVKIAIQTQIQYYHPKNLQQTLSSAVLIKLNEWPWL